MTRASRPHARFLLLSCAIWRGERAGNDSAPKSSCSRARQFGWKQVSEYVDKIMKALDPPHTINGDPNATEMLRLWAAHNKLNVAINIGSYEETGHDEAKAWGIILADLAKHVARALHQANGRAPDETIEVIRELFLA